VLPLLLITHGLACRSLVQHQIESVMRKVRHAIRKLGHSVIAKLAEIFDLNPLVLGHPKENEWERRVRVT